MATLITAVWIVLTIIASIVVIVDNKNPVNALAWLVVILFLPGLGLILYILLGVNYRRSRVYRRMVEKMLQEGEEKVLPSAVEDAGASLSQLVKNTAHQRLTTDNQPRFYFSGERWMDDLLRDIEAARSHVHVELFILKADSTGKRLRAALLRAAERGVRVRILLDKVGCWKIAFFKLNFLKPLKGHPNIEIGWFYPARIPYIQPKVNYRNHRKIFVIDGQVAYSGGMNVADEYLYGGKFPLWRDGQFRLVGSGVHALQTVFLSDWYIAKNQLLEDPHFFPKPEFRGAPEPSGVQIIPSGPDQRWETIAYTYFSMMNMAQEELNIQTPYLIPDEALWMALTSAALRGVSVKILVPSRPDHHVVYWASCSYFQGLLKAGVRIFTFEPGFIHTKMIISDHKVASLGSANLDFRSLYINFEIIALFYSPEEVQRLRKQFYHDLEQSREITLEEVRNWPWWVRFRNSVARLLSPLF